MELSGISKTGLLFILICWGLKCTSDKTFEKQIVLYCKDNIVNTEEWEKLTASIKAEKAKYTKKGFLVQGEINKKQLKTYIYSIAGDAVVIEEVKEANDESDKPVYNVFIENSGSMDGYVKGLSGFKNTVYKFLSDIKSPLRNITDSLHLFYINSKPIPFPDDVKDFIDKLGPSSFKKAGGKKGESDFSNILDTIFCISGENDVNILISDCVFSPGKHKDAKDYLTNQRIGIKNAFEAKLSKHRDLTSIVLKLKSVFDGAYYDYLNKTHGIKAYRPYYIWIMGASEAINDLLSKIEVNQFKEMQNMHVFATRRETPEYRVLLNKGIGSFSPDHKDMMHGIIDAQKEKKGPNDGFFQFVIGINLGNLRLDASYLESAKNYRFSSESYQINIESIPLADKHQNKLLENYSHYFLLKTSELKNEKLEIELLKKTPSWVEASNSEDDRNQTEEELNKTFGFKYLIGGISDAYHAASNDKNIYFKIYVSIKK